MLVGLLIDGGGTDGAAAVAGVERDARSSEPAGACGLLRATAGLDGERGRRSPTGRATRGRVRPAAVPVSGAGSDDPEHRVREGSGRSGPARRDSSTSPPTSTSRSTTWTRRWRRPSTPVPPLPRPSPRTRPGDTRPRRPPLEPASERPTLPLTVQGRQVLAGSGDVTLGGEHLPGPADVRARLAGAGRSSPRQNTA